MGETVKATGYLVFEGIRSRYGKQGVTQGKLRRVTQSRPSMTTDEIAVRITVEVPAAAFGPFQAEATVVVPEELVQNGVTVEAIESVGS